MLQGLLNSKSHNDGKAASPVHAGLIPAVAPNPEPERNRSFEYAFDCLPCNAMFCDRELILRYLNKSSKNTLRGLQKYLPVPVDEIVGKSIHIFHQNPSRVDQVLGAKHHHGQHQLPHRVVIALGPEKLDLEIEAMLDDNGQYVGVVVMWGVASQKVEAIKKKQDALRQSVEEVNQQLEVVSSATREIDSSIGNIARNATELARAIQLSSEAGKNSMTSIRSLQESSQGVARVADLIASIATQTSVLALNATIEAARAGVHGRGFSVVAGEVKKLAEQTAAATAEIQAKVSSIRQDTGVTVASIEEITKQNEGIAGLSHMLASAAEEQRLSTKEMASSIESAVRRTAEMVTDHG